MRTIKGETFPLELGTSSSPPGPRQPGVLLGLSRPELREDTGKSVLLCCCVMVEPRVFAILHMKTPFHPGRFRRKETSRNSQRNCRANTALSLLRLDPALQTFPTGSETLSDLLCKWGSEAFSSPAWLSLEDSQSLLKLCVFSGAASKVPGVRLPSVLYIERIFCVVYLMCLSQR